MPLALAEFRRQQRQKVWQRLIRFGFVLREKRDFPGIPRSVSLVVRDISHSFGQPSRNIGVSPQLLLFNQKSGKRILDNILHQVVIPQDLIGHLYQPGIIGGIDWVEPSIQIVHEHSLLS